MVLFAPIDNPRSHEQNPAKKEFLLTRADRYEKVDRLAFTVSGTNSSSHQHSHPNVENNSRMLGVSKSTPEIPYTRSG